MSPGLGHTPATATGALFQKSSVDNSDVDVGSVRAAADVQLVLLELELAGRVTRHAGARVSLTHANFVINDGTATAADIKALVEECRAAVKERFGVTLRDEIICLGQF